MNLLNATYGDRNWSHLLDDANKRISELRAESLEFKKAITQLKKLNDLFNSGDWSVLRGDGLMTLPYNEAEKVAEELQNFLVNLEKP